MAVGSQADDLSGVPRAGPEKKDAASPVDGDGADSIGASPTEDNQAVPAEGTIRPTPRIESIDRHPPIPGGACDEQHAGPAQQRTRLEASWQAGEA